MKNTGPVSEEQLNALLDHELDGEERTRILLAIEQNPALQARYNELRDTKNLVCAAYQDIPIPNMSNRRRWRPNYRYVAGFASAALVLLGILIGWTVNAYLGQSPDLNFQYVEQINTSVVKGDKILLHINTDDPNRVRASLQWAENLLQYSRTKHAQLDLEVVVNAEGLNILRTNSAYAQKIATLTQEYSNVKFLACGVAKQNATFRENKAVTLIPQANDIPAALDRIVTRMQEGWTYLRG